MGTLRQTPGNALPRTCDPLSSPSCIGSAGGDTQPPANLPDPEPLTDDLNSADWDSSPLDPEASSSLEPLESNQQIPSHIPHPRYGAAEWDDHAPITVRESAFRHSGWAIDRRRVYNAFATAVIPDRRRLAFADCGNSAYVQRDADTGEYRIVANCCHDRFCAPCQAARAARIARRLQERVESGRCRFLTLTQRATELPLRQQLDLLYRHFNELRRRKWWKDRVIGGAAFLEVKIGQGSNRWHAHLHILCEGRYLNQRELSAEWYAVTGASFIVDVRAVPDAAQRAQYVTKYVTKPASSAVYSNPERLSELILALRGRRMMNAFGSWRSWRLDAPEESAATWKTVERLDTLISAAASLDPDALRIITALARQHPALRQICPFILPYLEAPP